MMRYERDIKDHPGAFGPQGRRPGGDHEAHKAELLSTIYEIRTAPEQVNLDEMLKEYEAKDLLDLIRKMRAGKR